MHRYKIPVTYIFNCPQCGGKTTIRSNRINTSDHQRVKTRLCPNCGDFTTNVDSEGNEEFRAWVNTVKPKRVKPNCPECNQPLFSATGGHTTQAGYTIAYRQCKNEDCNAYSIRQSVRIYADGREEIFEPNDGIGDINQARRSLISQAFFDCLSFGGICDETKELAEKIMREK